MIFRKWWVTFGRRRRYGHVWQRYWNRRAPVHESQGFFKAVVQVVLLFGLETWVMTPCMCRYFGSFCYRVARRITGGQPKQWVHGSWDYPPMGTTMDEAGFEDIREYILKRQNLVAQYIVAQPILDLCEEMVRRSGVRVARRWWEQ